MNGFRKIVSAKKIKESCPAVFSSPELDHAVGMCVDHVYRNLYIKDETIKYLQENDFVFTKPKESRYGFYYKHCATTENYVIVDVVTFDEQKSLYVFDLLLVTHATNYVIRILMEIITLKLYMGSISSRTAKILKNF